MTVRMMRRSGWVTELRSAWVSALAARSARPTETGAVSPPKLSPCAAGAASSFHKLGMPPSRIATVPGGDSSAARSSGPISSTEAEP